jgi:outer membrane lipoprotein-sorting protein
MAVAIVDGTSADFQRAQEQDVEMITKLPAAVLVLALGAGGASAQTVEDVVRRYLEARGGLAKLRTVQSLRLTGTMEVPGEPPLPFALELKRPAKMRTEFTVEGQKGIRAYDGQTAWTVLPLPGEGARAMSAEDAEDAKAQADVDLSPLVDATAKGFSVELIGRDRVPGGDTFRLLVRRGQEPPRTLHVDTRSHLVVRTEESRLVEGQSTEFVTDVGDYRTAGGLVFPYRLEVGPKKSAERQRLVIRQIEVNPVIPDARFAFPGPKPAPARPKRKPPAVLP